MSAGRRDWSAAEREYLLAFADDEHLMGQQHTEWIGTAPFLEEDLAFASIAQDELGHAAALYELLGDADELAFRRDADGYRSCALVELPCPDWAEALARHWLYDLAERHRWQSLGAGIDDRLDGVVARARREEEYHRLHAAALVCRLYGQDGDAHERLDAAVRSLLPFADALWEPVAGEQEAHRAGLATVTSAQLRARWRPEVEAVVGPVPWDELANLGQDARRRRTEHFAALFDRITEVFRIDPNASW